jgi:7-cyano-7-deazaguanine synthase
VDRDSVTSTYLMKVVVLCSGGMDSIPVLHWANHEHELVGALSVNYGGKHNDMEIPMAAHHSQLLGIRHEVVTLDFVDRLFNSALLKSGGDVPEGKYEEHNMTSTVVPFRNAIMLSIACGFAESIGAEALAIGAHGGDHTIYPDCRPEFMQAMRDAMRLCTYAKIELICPFQSVPKSAFAAKGAELGVDFSKTYSCYKGGALHCGTCGTCCERRDAFADAGVSDPTEYAAAPAPTAAP